MPITQVGAIFATNSKLLQRVYIPHADDAEILQQHIHPGETLGLAPLEIYQKGGTVAVQELIGVPAHNGMCRVLHKDTGELIGYIIADPEIFRHPDGHHVVLGD